MINTSKPTERELINFLTRINSMYLKGGKTEHDFVEWVIWEAGRLYLRHQLRIDIGPAEM